MPHRVTPGAGRGGFGRRAGRVAFAVGAAAAGGYGVLQRLGRTSGSTAAERRSILPGDGLVTRPQVVTDHAATIDAPPSAVWPWLVQVGWHRAGWYTARWVDVLLFPANEAAADRIHPEWQDLAVGDRVLDGDPSTECWFVVDELEREHHLVLHSRSHLPPELRDAAHAGINWSWTFLLRDLGDGRTRLHIRTRARLAPWWLAAGYVTAMVPADHIMASQMLAGIATRAEGRIREIPGSHENQVRDTAAGLALMAVTPLIRPFHLRWGATSSEAHGPVAGDDLVPVSHFTATRAITIDAPPDDVWPWLMQVGITRAGFYSYDLLDHHGEPSADQVLEQWQDLVPGDVVAPMADPATDTTAFRIAVANRPHRLVWSKPDSTWAWELRPIDGNRTRLVTRLKVRYRPGVQALLTIPLIEFGDFAMMRRMLLNIRRRSTRT